WHHTRDEALARALWPHVRRAVEHMDALRRSELEDRPLQGGRRMRTNGHRTADIAILGARFKEQV
ncbi:MAG TPA: hypothetical protein VLL05_19135, partial [Terriglobales bacterium]|nr:hypothetical protein [Terriglobales bacterium]